MREIILLFVLGIGLLAADAFVASFALAICGFVAMLGGCALAYQSFGTLAAGLAGLAAVLLLGITLYLELVVLPRTRYGRGLTVHSTSGQAAPPPATAEIIGQAAEALTTLAPSGYVAIAGRRYDAFSQSGLIAKGESVRVIGLDNFRLIVSKSQ
jgi:membrane-bound serine protease (ClpP class)